MLSMRCTTSTIGIADTTDSTDSRVTKPNGGLMSLIEYIRPLQFERSSLVVLPLWKRLLMAHFEDARWFISWKRLLMTHFGDARCRNHHFEDARWFHHHWEEKKLRHQTKNRITNILQDHSFNAYYRMSLTQLTLGHTCWVCRCTHLT